MKTNWSLRLFNLADQPYRSYRVTLVMAAMTIVALLLLAAGIGRALASEERPQTAASAALPLPMTRADYFLPGTQPNTLTHELLEPTSCNTCHTDPIYKAWRGSMMGQAGRDPMFWAAFAVAQKDATDAGEFCLRCHAPRGWFAGRSDPADGSALTPEDINAGLACEVCHRMVDPVAGAQDETATIDAEIRAALTDPPPTDHFASAMLILDPEDRRRGPFSFPPSPIAGPHQRWQANFQGQEDPLAASRLCGSCHNVDNPLLSWTENPPGDGPAQYWPNEADAAAPSFAAGALFPVERTYYEWLYSDYANGGVYAPQFAGFKPDGIVSSCQDCHMARTVGEAAESFFSPVFRDCVTTGCLPAHVFVGGNTWVPQIIQDPRWRLNSAADASALNQTTVEARDMLRRAATLQLTVNEGEDTVTVRVTNEIGHKLPTGYPEGRRMWLNLRAYDADGRLIYESGAYDTATGVLDKDPAIKVYEAEQGLTPELAAVVGLEAGPTFHFALNNTTIKDNRIPPRGYTVAGFDRPGMRPVGATYVDGQYWDDTEYTVPKETARIVATLYYQLTSGEYVEFLRTNGGADGATLGQLWDDSKSPPEVVAQAEYPAPNVHFIPVAQGD